MLPSVSIIILVWNNVEMLKRCFQYLSAQTFTDFEVIVIDNGSKDDILDELSFHWPEIRIFVERLDENKGFALANNIGAYRAKGEWIVLLNADAYPEPDWLEQLLRVAEQNPGFVFFSSRQLQYFKSEFLDGAGDAYHVSGLAWRRYYNRKVEEYGKQQEEIFGACAAASMYRREDFLKVGGFDEDYFSYFEDVDLSFRLRLAGGRCLYVPEAVVHHVGSSSTGKLSDFVVYHGHRNLVWTYFKDMPTMLFWLFLPLHILMNLFFIVSFIFKRKTGAILRAKWDAIRGIPSVLRKRRKVQGMRVVSYWEIVRFMSKGILEPYWAFRERTQQGGSGRI